MKNAPMINFVQNRVAQQRRCHGVLAILGLAFGVQLGVTAWRVQALQSAQHSVSAQQQNLARKSVSYEAAALTPEQRQAIAQTHQMLHLMAVPWDAMLKGIEAARPASLVLDALQPDAQEQVVKVTASAPDFDTLALFVQRLGEQSVFDQVRLESEALPESGAGHLRAVIHAQWRRTP